MVDSNDSMREVIFQVLRDYYAVPEKKLSSQLSINRDLGIDGDDAVELVRFLEERIGRRIEINLSDYFYGEGLIQFASKQNLSVNDLQNIIFCG